MKEHYCFILRMEKLSKSNVKEKKDFSNAVKFKLHFTEYALPDENTLYSDLL